jgi:hypothetical protein
VPVQLTPRPQPGDLITAEWMNRLADAIAELQGQVEALDARLDKLERPKLPPVGIKVPWDPTRFDDFIVGIRDKDILKITNERERFERVLGEYLDVRDELSGGKLTGDITPQELINLAPAAGLSVTKGTQVLAEIDPVAAKQVTETIAESGTSGLALNAKISEGKISGAFLRLQPR